MKKIGYEVVYYQCIDSESFALTLGLGPSIIYIHPTGSLGTLFYCDNSNAYHWYDTACRVELVENDSYASKNIKTMKDKIVECLNTFAPYDDFRCVLTTKEEIEHKFSKELTTSPLNCLFRPVYSKCQEILENARQDVETI